jgi:hypothetical protein
MRMLRKERYHKGEHGTCRKIISFLEKINTHTSLDAKLFKEN